jgi:hypothetical protein
MPKGIHWLPFGGTVGMGVIGSASGARGCGTVHLPQNEYRPPAFSHACLRAADSARASAKACGSGVGQVYLGYCGCCCVVQVVWE